MVGALAFESAKAAKSASHRKADLSIVLGVVNVVQRATEWRRRRRVKVKRISTKAPKPLRKSVLTQIRPLELFRFRLQPPAAEKSFSAF